MADLSHLLKADEVAVPLGLKVNDATPLLLPLIEAFELFLLP